MLISAHAISAGVVGIKIANPPLAFLFGIIIHFLLDSIPHYDTTDEGKWTLRQWTLLFVDIVLGSVMIFLVLRLGVELNSSFFWGALGGIFIDLVDVCPFWKKSIRKTTIGSWINKIHDRAHTLFYKKQVGFWPGILSQIIIILLAIYMGIR